MEIGNRIDELQLACAAMWELLREKNGVSDNELIEKIKEIDMRDGNPDGKMISPTEKCPECGHNLLIRARDVCSWCGALMKQSPFSN